MLMVARGYDVLAEQAARVRLLHLPMEEDGDAGPSSD
jgi:hypothetical protein